MTLYELKEAVDAAVEKGLGNTNVAFGDMNGYYTAGQAGVGFVEDEGEYCMEPSDEGDMVFVVAE